MIILNADPASITEKNDKKNTTEKFLPKILNADLKASFMENFTSSILSIIVVPFSLFGLFLPKFTCLAL
ncbi:hypothetical protein AGMMS50233_06090 [Endomicrobiia bacterium]|nr:hypothetical protein AGMMS50233_06090 [Endomicrobiia bacterium]